VLESLLDWRFWRVEEVRQAGESFEMEEQDEMKLQDAMLSSVDSMMLEIELAAMDTKPLSQTGS